MTMTGTGISVDLPTLQAKFDEIAAIDEQLDAASGSVTAGRRALANSLATQYEGDWKKLADGVKNQLAKIDEDNMEQLAGVVNGIVASINEVYKSKIDEWLDAQVEARQSTQEVVPPEEIETLNKTRKALVEAYKALRGILVLYELDVSSIPEPKKRTGARGPRGKRVLQGFDYYIDGELRTEKQNSLSSVANTICAPLGWKTLDLRHFIADQGFDLENPPDEIVVQLPDPVNKELRIERGEPQVVLDEDDDDENGEDEDDE